MKSIDEMVLYIQYMINIYYTRIYMMKICYTNYKYMINMCFTDHSYISGKYSHAMLVKSIDKVVLHIHQHMINILTRTGYIFYVLLVMPILGRVYVFYVRI
jgi:hypothetical protein